MRAITVKLKPCNNFNFTPMFFLEQAVQCSIFPLQSHKNYTGFRRTNCFVLYSRMPTKINKYKAMTYPRQEQTLTRAKERRR